jgi:oligopeptidase B
MNNRILGLLAAVCFTVIPNPPLAGHQERELVLPPVAKIVPMKLEKHGHVRVDNYYWLNERENPEVIRYLEAENEYTEAVMAHTKAFREFLFEEIKGRIKRTDVSAPYRLMDYIYYTRYEDDKEYPIYCRKKGSMEGVEEVLIDANLLAEGHKYFDIEQFEVSSNQDLLAYPVDTVGRRIYTIYIKDLRTGKILEDVIPDVTSSIAWANDNKTIFYTRQDPVTLRWYQVYRHVLGTDPSEDILVYEEKDDTFWCGVFKTKSRKYIMLYSDQTLSTEYMFLDADHPMGEFQVIQPRERDHEYHVDHFADHFYIRTNLEAKNFRLMRTPLDKTGKQNWEEVIPHRNDTLLESAEIFSNFLVLEERKDGLVKLRVLPWSGKDDHYIDFGEPAYQVATNDNYDFDTLLLRYTYTSMTTPKSVYDYNMASREKALLKQEEVLGGFDPGNYRTERLWAMARDGVRVPISIVYRKGLRKDGGNPLLLYGYGSYGISTDANFRSYRLSLLDRGFVYAIAHVRGGAELGRQWYEDGKLLKKMNTFTDFIDCAEYLVRQGYSHPDQLFAWGGSAGGLLMGVIINMRPDLFKGVIADVPFVDVVTTMLDESIPLTTAEYDEWGNPNEKGYYDYMLSYSPYDNIEAKEYPHLLIITSLHDSQVQYFEPAKWIAKLRATKTGRNRLLMKTQMEAGHSGVSGRFKMYEDLALTFAFVLDLVDIRE